MDFGAGMPDQPEPEQAPPPPVDINTADQARRRNAARQRRTSRTGLIIEPTSVTPTSTGLSIPGPTSNA